ncbi:MAG: redoxin domain-containing protein [Halobacteriaceae archaeon]
MTDLATGDAAPMFTATTGTSEHQEFALEDHVGEGTLVLAFFPGAFTPPCTNEMIALQERLAKFHDAGATLFGISADSPFVLGAFREEHGLEFDLVSDMNRDAITAYGIEMDIPDLGLYGIANRAIYVLDREGIITHSWVADDPTNEPDYEEILVAVEST